MIRTARIILAGLLHILAAKVDVYQHHGPYTIEIDIPQFSYPGINPQDCETDEFGRPVITYRPSDN